MSRRLARQITLMMSAPIPLLLIAQPHRIRMLKSVNLLDGGNFIVFGRFRSDHQVDGGDGPTNRFSERNG